jgi:hypothetical protein
MFAIPREQKSYGMKGRDRDVLSNDTCLLRKVTAANQLFGWLPRSWIFFQNVERRDHLESSRCCRRTAACRLCDDVFRDVEIAVDAGLSRSLIHSDADAAAR